jgi:LysM repeat protein
MKSASLFLFLLWSALTIKGNFFQFDATDGKKMSRSEYINHWKDEAILQMALHKIPASITLAQGILESADGNSELASKSNNHFGIKCHDDWKGDKVYHDDDSKGECFRKYEHARESFEDHSLFLKRKRYEALFELKTDDYEAWARGLKKAGYATNPQYADLLIRIIEENKLHEFDKEGMKFIKSGELPDGNKAPVAALPNESKKGKGKKNKGDGDVPSEITLGSGRQVKFSENDIKYIIAKKGDSFKSLAEELDMMPWQFKKYNELNDNSSLEEGQIIYLQPKRNKSRESASYLVQEGETLWQISQKFGVKVNKLRKYNNLEENATVKPGETLKLR